MSKPNCPDCGSELRTIRGTTKHRPRSWFQCPKCGVEWTNALDRIYGRVPLRGLRVPRLPRT